MNVRKKYNIQVAVELYYSTDALDNQDIMRLFSCCRSTAEKLKQIAKKQEAQEERTPHSPSTVNVLSAFGAWGIDIKNHEKRLLRKQQLISKGVLSC